MQKWCQFINMKVELDFAGQKDIDGLLSMQVDDPVFKCIRENFNKRYKQFKRYFVEQHPYIPTPDTHTHPN